MVTKNETKNDNVQTNEEYLEEEVEVFLPKESGEMPSKYIGLNGQSWLIPRGKRVSVPRKVALVLEDAQALRDEADEFSDEEQKKMLVVQGAPA